MTGLARVKSDATVRDVIGLLARDGGVIVEDFLTSETLAGLRSDLLPLLERQAAGPDGIVSRDSGHDA